MSEHQNWSRPEPAEPTRPKRHDQTRCPDCGAWGCPASRGSYTVATGRVRYRKCQACGFPFKTILRLDGKERVIP